MGYSLDTPIEVLQDRANELVGKRVYDGLAEVAPRAFAWLSSAWSNFELLYAVQEAERHYPWFWRELERLEFAANGLLIEPDFETLPKEMRLGLIHHTRLSLASLRYVVCMATTIKAGRQIMVHSQQIGSPTLQMAV